MQALELTEKDTVVCITGSGSRTLDLLTAGPRRIYSVDMNPCQSFLMELKLAGIRNLTYDDLLGFLGVEEDQCRIATYTQLRPHLSTAAKAYWDGKLLFIAQGILYQGRWERYFSRLAAFLQVVRGSLLNEVFSAPDVERQYALFQNHWDGPFWRGFIRSISPNVVWKYAFGDPGFFTYVPKNFLVHEYLLERFGVSFRTRLLRESPFMTLLFRGRYFPDEALPLHLRRDQHQILRERLGRITVVTAKVDEFLRSQTVGTVNAFSLSDVSSYTSPEQYRDVWSCIAATGGRGARICERQFLVKRSLPDSVAGRVRRDHLLEDALEASDDSTFYTFIAGSLAGGEQCS